MTDEDREIFFEHFKVFLLIFNINNTCYIRLVASNTGGSLHTGGCISTHDHAIHMVCIHETYKLHWTLFVIGFELCFMITYYSIIQCFKVRYLIILHWIISSLRSWMILFCIRIILFMFVVYR